MRKQYRSATLGSMQALALVIRIFTSHSQGISKPSKVKKITNTVSSGTLPPSRARGSTSNYIQHPIAATSWTHKTDDELCLSHESKASKACCKSTSMGKKKHVVWLFSTTMCHDMSIHDQTPQARSCLATPMGLRDVLVEKPRHTLV